MRSELTSALGAVIITTAMAGGAQAQASPSRMPVRQLGTPVATSSDPLGSVAAVRQLPNGTVLVNDQTRRRVVILDSSLKEIGVSADSTASTANAYGARPGGLISWKGDSTLFVDPASLSMLVLDPAGKIVRVMAAPRPSDVMFLTGGPLGTPGFDTQGRLVYRTIAIPSFRGGPPQPGVPFVPPTPPDSSPLVRFDLVARKLDTAVFYRVPKANVKMTQDENGGMRVQVTINPLPVVDEWAVLSNGTIAVVRGQDYHVDLIAADGTRRSAPKIPYEWQRLTDDDKVKFIDSVKVAMERARTSIAQSNGGAGTGSVPAGSAPAGGGTQMIVMGGDGPGGGGQRIQIGGGPGGLPPLNFVTPADLPDYKPVFGVGAVKADADDRLWVRTIATRQGGPVYDVIDAEGRLVDRIQVPVGTTIAGFGKGGVVYLGVRGDSGLKLEKFVVR